MAIQKKTEIRVRFAPSPTGPLHIGGVRTALYNFLFARKNEGKFILRIEDTDQKRFVPGAEKYIFEALNWCGLDPDEGPGVGGGYGPYRQSERRLMYKSFVQQLLDSGHAYYAFDAPEELDEMRARMKAAGVSSPTYNNITRSSMKNSLTLPKEETTARIAAGEKYVVRIKMPRDQEIRFEDKIRGWVSVNTNNIDDKVICKSDGMPTYHLANIIDDYSMKISHVIRGEEWLPSAPLHVYLYQCFGWENIMPEFAHLPLILKPDGNGKLSKRDGDRLGFPVFPIDWLVEGSGEVLPGYREQGFSKEAFINMLAFLGWNPGTDQEVFMLSELTSAFSLDRVGKSGAKYDFSKTKWFNQQHLRRINNVDLLDQILKTEENLLASFSKEYLLDVIALVKERAVFLTDIIVEAEPFLSELVTFDQNLVDKKWNLLIVPHLENIINRISDLDDFNSTNIERVFNEYLNTEGVSMGKIMPMLRIAIMGKLAGPSMFDSLAVIGKSRAQKRIKRALEIN